MNCPFCGSPLPGLVKFCQECGRKIPEAAQEPYSQMPVSGNKGETGGERNHQDKGKSEEVSYDTANPLKNEYKTLLRETIIKANGLFSPEDIIALARKAKDLKLEKYEAINLQRDVAKELGFEVYEEGELLSGDILLEINTNKNYISGQMNNLEFKLTNISGDPLEQIYLSTHLLNLKTDEGTSLRSMGHLQNQLCYSPFHHTLTGNEIVEICLRYFDAKGNPSVYRTSFEVEVFQKEADQRGQKSITISFNAQKIMGNDFSDMAQVLDKEDRQIQPKGSSYQEQEKHWRRLFIYLDEEETHKKRDEIVIKNKKREGEDNFKEARHLIEAGDRSFGQDGKKTHELFKNSLNYLREAEKCYLKIREVDPEEGDSLQKIEEIRGIIAQIKDRIGVLEKEPDLPKIRISVGCFSLKSPTKRIYVFSKDRIIMGRDSKRSDLVSRLIPYGSKEEHPENWKKNKMISGVHAEIVTKGGNFYVRDVGSDGQGSLNGTFMGGKRFRPLEEVLIQDGLRVSLARILDLEFNFFGGLWKKQKEKSTQIQSSCFTVLGEVSESCFGIDKKGPVDAIKIRRRNNFVEGEEYIILIREITIGSNGSNAIVLDGEKVSDIHAKIFYRDNQYWLEDLNSRHCTWINERQAKPGMDVPLSKEADIILGDIRMQFKGLG